MNIFKKTPFALHLILAVLIFFSVSPAHSSATPQNVNLTLKTAMEMAIRNNIDLRVDALDSSISESNIKRNRGIYDPNLSMSVNRDDSFYTGEEYGTQGTRGSLGLTQYLPSGGSLSASAQTDYSRPLRNPYGEEWTDWYTSIGITYIQPLLKNFGKETMELNITLAENAHEDSIERFRESVINTIYDVIRAYNRLYTLRQVLESRDRALTSARKLLSEIKKRGKTGVKQEIDLSNAEYAINRRLKDIVDAERAISDQEARLRYLIGDQSTVDIIPVDPPSGEEPMETTDQAISLALKKHPDLKQLRLDLEASELQQRVSKKKLLPNLSVNASAGLRGIEDTFSQSTDQIGSGKGRWWSAGLQLSVPLGNSVAKSDHRRNELRTQQLKNRIAASEWKFRDDIESDMRALMSFRIQRQVAEKAVKISEMRVENYINSLAGNSSKIQDLINADNDLIVARDNQTEALEDFANGVALLWKDSGVLLERMNIRININEPEQLTAGTLPLPFPKEELASTSSKVGVAESELDKEAAIPSADKVDEAPISKPVSTVKIVPSAKERVTAKKDEAIYFLKIGEFASSELGALKEKVKVAGLIPQITPGSKQPREVIRLSAGDFRTNQDAKKVLSKLQQAKAGAFIVKQGQGYRLYAGSFFSQDSAQREQKRLAARGIDVTLKKSTVLLPTSLLTAGQFSRRELALAEAQKLEKMGIKSTVQKKDQQL